jgi:electron transfer flavoprotein beta subunit
MGLHIIVCIKSVVLRATGTKIVRTPELCELNSFDRPALETALCLKESHGGSVTALTMGPADTGSAVLHEAMAMGVDRGVLLSDPALIGSDTLATSTAIGAAVAKLSPYDLVLFGTRTSDSDTGQVGPQTAALLDLPLVTSAMSLEKNDSGLRVNRISDEFVETFETAMPAVLTIHPASVQPRDVSLMGIQRTFEKNSIETLELSDIGLSADQVGDAGSGTRVLSMSRVSRKRTCDFVEGSVEEQADILLNKLVKLGLVG